MVTIASTDTLRHGSVRRRWKTTIWNQLLERLLASTRFHSVTQLSAQEIHVWVLRHVRSFSPLMGKF